MTRLEQIAYDYGLCSCDEAYSKRGLTAPDCPWHAYAVEEAMEDYAKEVARHNLERAAEQAMVIHYQHDHGSVIDKESITSLEIELI